MTKKGGIKNLRQFNMALNRHVQVMIPSQALKFHRSLAFEAYKRIMLKTPVDTGRARGNWQLTFDKPATGETGKTDKSGQDGIRGALFELTKLRLGQVVWITNNVPYAQKLEMGSSKQAPRGMVATTLAELQALKLIGSE